MKDKTQPQILKKLSDVDWFNAKAYRAFKDLTKNELLSELIRRHLLQYKPLKELDSFLNEINESPLHKDISGDTQDRNDHLEKYKYSATVLEPTFEDLYFRLDIERDIYKNTESITNINDLSFLSLQQHNKSHAANILGEKKTACTLALFVSLDARNSTIMGDFEEKIKESRLKYGIPEPLETEKIDTIITKIINYRSIAFFDVSLWAKVNDWKISNSAMARILFPDDLNRSDRDIRDYTIKYANIMLSKSFINSIPRKKTEIET